MSVGVVVSSSDPRLSRFNIWLMEEEEELELEELRGCAIRVSHSSVEDDNNNELVE